MKVGVYCAGYTPDAGGGYTFEEDVLKSLEKLASNSKHEFILFMVNPSGEALIAMRKLVKEKMRVIGVSQSSSLLRTLLMKVKKTLKQPVKHWSAFQDALEKESIEMVWFPSPACVSIDVPYITTIWDLQHRLQPWFPEVGVQTEWSMREADYSQMLRRATCVIVGAQAGKEEVRFFYQIPEQRIRILPHPCPSFTISTKNAASAPDSVLKKYNLERGFLFYPAQFWSHKNHANLLLALKSLKEKHGRVMTLALAGSEKGNQDYIREYAKQLGLERQVIFLGFVPRDDLIVLYQNAFALVYLTFFGPENLPPLEAFSLGCPVVASAVSGAQEQLGDAAILVNPVDPESVADAVNDLLEYPNKRRELIERGQKRALQWTSKDFVYGIFSILNEFESIRRAWR